MLQLNSNQQKAVEVTDRHLLVLAGAGSGKTRVITSKIINLIENLHVPSYAICAITFTNKAAAEMRERIALSLSPDRTRALTVRTFHSFGAFFLRSFIHLLPPYQTNFSITDSGQTTLIIKKCASHLGENYEKKDPRLYEIIKFISNAKNLLLSPDDDEKYFREIPCHNIALSTAIQIYRQYQKEMEQSNSLDFDDLICKPILLLRKSEECREYIKSKFQYLLIDEYQDTNYPQEQLISEFYKQGVILTAVGDDDQSIYGFRGALLSNIQSFPSRYPNSMVLSLDRNYRSYQNILLLANEIIKQNSTRPFPKELYSKLSEGALPEFVFYPDDRMEAMAIAKKILKYSVPGKKVPFSTAIFYRNNYQSRKIEEAFHFAKIPYQLIGSIRFYERAEIQNMVAYLKLLSNGSDALSFERVVNFPPRGIGEKSIEKILNHKRPSEKNCNVEWYLESPPPHLSSKTVAKLNDFCELILKYRALLQNEFNLKNVNKFFKETGFKEHYLSLKDPTEGEQRLENLYSFLESVEEYRRVNEAPSLEGFLADVSLHSDTDDMTEEKNSVKVMTIHCAKGLEFDKVFLIGCEEKVLPHYRSMESEEGLDEERRLFYVAVTRAKQEIFLSGASRKFTYGEESFNSPSRFVLTIPDKILLKLDPFGKKLTTRNLGDLYDTEGHLPEEEFSQGFENHEYF